MTHSTAREKFANFLSYVVFFGFVIGVGAVAYYFYSQTKNKAADTRTATDVPAEGIPGVDPALPPAATLQNPSQLLAPVMASHLPALLNDFGKTPVELQASFNTAEQIIRREMIKPGKWRPAWQVANELGREIRTIYAERQVAVDAVAKRGEPPVASGSISKIELEERASRQEFFRRAAQQRWNATVPARKQKIEALYRRLLTLEAQAAL